MGYNMITISAYTLFRFSNNFAVSNCSEQEITAMTLQVCDETSVGFKTFRRKLTCFCKTLKSLIDDCSHYTSPTAEVVKIVKKCFESARATLNYRHKEGTCQKLRKKVKFVLKMAHWIKHSTHYQKLPVCCIINFVLCIENLVGSQQLILHCTNTCKSIAGNEPCHH